MKPFISPDPRLVPLLSRRTFLNATALGLGGLLVGCGGGSSTSLPTPSPIPTDGPGRGTGDVLPQAGWTINNTAYRQYQKEWTFLVYMNGANDLEPYGSLNLNQMEKIGSSSAINMVVQFKRIANRYDDSNGNWSGTRRYYVTQDAAFGSVNSYLLSTNAGLDMGDAQSLSDFIRWGVATYPASRYCLVLWNHGAGWRSVKRLTRGFSYDDVTNNHIDTIELPQAIDLGGGKKWDVVAFDSSLMQMMEVAYEIRNQATYIVGSEESPPGEGYPYNRFLANLNANPGMGTRDFASDIAQQTINAYTVNSNITQSVLDTSKIAAILPAVDNLGRLLFENKGFYRTEIAYARSNAEGYDYPYYHDLIDFTRLLLEPIPGTLNVPIPNTEIRNAAALVRQRVQDAVIKNVNSNQHPRSNGLSIFLPSPSQFEDIDISQANGFGQRYKELSFAKDAPNWLNFIKFGPV